MIFWKLLREIFSSLTLNHGGGIAAAILNKGGNIIDQ